MNFLVISGNPKKDGLCNSVIEEVVRGATDGGASVEVLSTAGFNRCRVCGEGWGICRNSHKCVYEDDGFNESLDRVKNADAVCLVSPVYWGEVSENLKCYMDKLRRCQFGQNGYLAGKSVLLIASPGGSGNGMLPCLTQMDSFCRHMNASIFDYIGVNRWNCEYKRTAAYNAAKEIVIRCGQG